MSNLVDFSLPAVPLPLTVSQKAELESAQKMPFIYDEDNPPLTTEQLKRFKRVNPIIRQA